MNMYYHRQIEPKIIDSLFKGKVVIIYGPRQAGKTTLIKEILKKYSGLKTVYFNCDEEDVSLSFSQAGNSSDLKQIIGSAKLAVLDEAQRVNNIGLKLKLLVDTYPEVQIIASGSSSFELSDKIIEPLTGRSREFYLLPFGFSELGIDNIIESKRILPSLLVYGSYPEVVTSESFEDKKTSLKNIADKYLGKDILRFKNIRNSGVILRLIQALALQVGQEVSFNEIAGLTGIDKKTVESYVDILEKAYIIFRLPPFSNNRRQELNRLRKIYFFDTGIRNAVINNLNSINLRDDVGRLWENFIISERMKKIKSLGFDSISHFWRTYEGAEVDLVEEQAGSIKGYEIKWQKQRKKPPLAWLKNYPRASWEVITKDNFPDFL